MSAPKGNRNNPNGRPPKNKALTNLLEASLGHTIDVDGKKVSGKRILADMVTSVLTTGRMRFPNDTEDSIISIQDWIGMVKWVYDRVDGRPMQQIGGEGEDGDIVIRVQVGNNDD